MSVRKGLWVFLLLAQLGPALAQEQSGAIRGTVTDPSGSGLAAVTVTVSGAGAERGVTVETDRRGRYRFPALPPGSYRLVAARSGFAPAAVPGIELALGADRIVDLELALEAVTATIEVSAEAPLIEATRSATATSIRGELIDKLPRGRDFTSVVTQAAHAAAEGAAGGISIDGSSGSENRFVVDGVDTTNLQTGTAGKSVVIDHVQEVQVKSSGYMAEFGGATGGVISVVTETGTGRWRGELGGYFTSSQLEGDLRPSPQRNPDSGAVEYRTTDSDQWQGFETGFSLGGPVFGDRMRLFLGFSPGRQDVTRTIDYGDPAGVVVHPQRYRSDHLAVNLAGTLGNRVSYKVAANVSDRGRDNILPSASGTDDPFGRYDVDNDRPNRAYSGHLDWLVSRGLALSLRGGTFRYDDRDRGIPDQPWYGFSTQSAGPPGELFPDLPPALVRPLGFQNVATNSGTKRDRFRRDSLELDATWYRSGFGGEHAVKAGVQLARTGNEVLRGYQDTRILFYWGASRVDLEGASRGGRYGHYRVFQIATQGEVESDAVALFLQDSWRPTPRLTLNLGVRAEAETIPSYATQPGIPETAIEFDFDDKVAPRLGFAYDLLGDARWKLYGSYGVFYDVTKLEMPRGLFGGDKWVDFFFALDTLDWRSIVDDPSCRISAANSVAEVPSCPGELLFAADRRHPANDPRDPSIDPGLEPMESRELTLGVEHQIGRRTVIALRYVHKALKRTIEDAGVVVPGVGEVFYIVNPGEGIGRSLLGPSFPDQPPAKRDYDGLELDFRLRATERWTVHLSYLYSRLFGNYSGLASSDELGRTSPNVNRFFDALPMSFDAAGQPVYGRLGTDRPHQLKVQAIFRAPWKTSIGVNQYLGSGTPLSTQYSVSPGLPFFPYGRGDLGRTPTLTQTDLYLEHPITIGRFELLLSLNVLNLFDEDTVVGIDTTPLLGDLPLSNEAFFAGFDPQQVAEAAGVPRDPLFGLANAFQGRRSVRVGLQVRF